MSDASDPKAALRRTAFDARKTAFAAAAPRVAKATERLLERIGSPGGCVVAGYMPIRTEIDPLPAMTALHKAGAPIGVPVIAGPGQPLDFREWTPEATMVEGPFKARIPDRGAWLTPTTLIVPLVGFDRSCNRLGYGGGFYDRTLARLKAEHRVTAIGFAFAAQELPQIPVEDTDETLDAIVTEQGCLERVL